MALSPRRPWSKAEKRLLLTPALVGIFALAISVGPDLIRKKLGRPIQLATTAGAPLITLDLPQDGSVLAVGEQLNRSKLPNPPVNSIDLWDAKTLKPLPPITRPVIQTGRKPDHYTRSLTLSPTGRFVAYSQDFYGFGVFDRKLQKNLWQKTQHIDCIRYSPDAKQLAAGNSTTYRIFEANTGHKIKEWQPRTEIDGATLEFSPDGQRLASVGGLPKQGKTTKSQQEKSGIELRRTTDWTVEHVFPLNLARYLAFSPDGKLLVAVGFLSDSPGAYIGTIIRCFDVQSRRVLWELNTNDTSTQVWHHLTTGLCFSSDGKLAVFGLDRVMLLDPQTGQVQRQLVVPASARPRAIYYTPIIKFSPDGKRLFAVSSNTLLVWDLT